MFQNTTVFAGVGIGIANGTQPVEGPPNLDSGIHLRWANTSIRGYPRFGHYLLRRPSRVGASKPISIATDQGQALITSTTTDTTRLRMSTADTNESQASNWFEFEFTDRSYIRQVDVLFTAGTTSGTTITAQADGEIVDESTVSPGTISRQTISVSTPGPYISTLRIEGDVDLITDVRLSSRADTLDKGWEFVPGVDQPLSLPVAHDDYPATSAPSSLSAARTMARNRIAYGSASRFVAPEATTTADGTVAVTTDSSLVTGTNTSWTAELIGESLQLDGDVDAYTILTVIADDRLVLTRPYAGSDATAQPYVIRPDTFASIHDSLTSLVSGGSADGGMAARAVPQSIEETGTISRTSGSATVTGQGTAWADSLEGLSLQVAHPTTGTVVLTDGETTVEGIGTAWTAALEGAIFIVDGQRTRYEIAAVTDSAELELDRPYVGPQAARSTGGSGYTTYERAVTRIERVHSTTELELAHTYSGVDDTSDRSYRILGAMGDGDQPTGGGSVRLPVQYPYELLSVGSIDPALSQLLGMYWIDDTVETGREYDYLLVADFTGIVHLFIDAWGITGDDNDVATFQRFVRGLVAAAEYDYADAFLVSELVKGDTDPSPPSAPKGVQVYDLPESTATGTNRDRYAAGLTWALPHVDGRLPVDAPAAYYLWRTALGETPGESSPPEATYTPVGGAESASNFLDAVDPILVTDDATTETVPSWPTEAIYAVDGHRPAGWYSYRLNGSDIFGRHSPVSNPATWFDHETGARTTHAVHPAATAYAVELRTRLPPPPPTGVTATVLDPQDPSSIDEAARAWWDANGEQVALRINWEWPAAFDAQAPDTDAFDCYVELGSLNSHAGRVNTVTQSADISRIETSLAHTRNPAVETTQALPPGAFAGAALHVAGSQFTIVDSGGGADLWVDIRTRAGPDGPLVPASDIECSIAVPPVYTRGTATVVDGTDVVRGSETDWVTAFDGQSFRLAVTGDIYTVAAVESPTRLRLDRPYVAPPNRDDREAVAYAIDHPASTDYSEPTEWTHHVDDVSKSADRPSARSGGDRRYETTVPAPGATGGAFDPGVGPDERPVVHANVGVSARVDTVDGPLRGDVGGPAPVTRVHRDPPAPPVVPPLASELDWATRPDYSDTSYYTIRWERPPSGVNAHIYRTMDRTLFRVDWERRHNDDAFVLSAEQSTYFPVSLRGDDAGLVQRREEIVRRLGDNLTVGSFADAESVYETLEPDELQTLAALPGNEVAFTQLTTNPVSGAATPNVRGPDFEAGDPGPGTQPGVDGVPDTMPVGDALCAYVDGFDGRSRNRYLYRVATVDDAHNRGTAFGDPTPPVQARDGVPPEPPVITSVNAGHPDTTEPGDRQITLRWNSVQSPQLSSYHVYRTDDPDATRDIRLMTDAATLTVPLPVDGDPLTTGKRDGAGVLWTDDDRDPGVEWYYRIVAKDDAGSVSAASSSVGSRSFDTTPPTPPTGTTAEWVRLGPDGTTQPYADPTPTGERWQSAISLTWDTPDDLRVLVEMAVERPSSDFVRVSEWLTGEDSYIAPLDDETLDYHVRLRVLDERGRQTTGTPVSVVAPGGGSS